MRSSVFKYIFVLDIGSLPYALAITLHMNMLKEYKFIVTKKIFWDKCNDIMFIWPILIYMCILDKSKLEKFDCMLSRTSSIYEWR